MTSPGGKEVGRISIRVVPNTSRFREELRAQLEEIESAAKAKIDIEPNMDGFREKIKAETAGLDAKVNVRTDVRGDKIHDLDAVLDGLHDRVVDVKVKPNVDQTGFIRVLAQVKAAAKEAGVKLDVDFRDTRAEARLAELIAKLKAEAAAAHIDLKIGAKQNGIADAGISGISAAGDGAEAAGQQFLGLSRVGWIVAAVFAAAAPAIGLVAGLLAGLPSLIAAVALPMGALALGFNGIKQAAEATGLFSENKKGKGGLGPQLQQLQSAVSSVFATGLVPVFQQLLTLMPALQTGFVGIAQSIVGLAKGFTSILTSSGGIAQIQTIFQGVQGFVSQLTPSIQAFTSTFLTLGAEGAKSFGLLLAPIQQFATQFDQMIGKVANNGVLQGAFQGLSQTLGSLLNLFSKLFESGLQAMGQLGGPLSTLIDGLGNAVIALMPALTTLAAFIGNVLGSALTALAPVITAITPAFTALANTLGAILTSNIQSLAPVLTEIATALGGALVTGLQALQPLLPGLLTAFQQLATVFGDQLATYLPPLAQAFGQFLAAVVPLVPALLDLASKGLAAILPALVTLAPVVVAVVSAFAGFVGALSGVFGGLLSATGAVQGFSNTALASVLDFVGKAIAALAEFPGKAKAAMGNLGSILIDAGKSLMDGLLSGIKAGLSAVLSFAGSIAAKIAAVKGPISVDKTILTPNGQALMQGLQDGIEGGLQGVLSRASQIAGQINDAINSGSNGVNLGQLPDQLKQSMSELGIEDQQLRVQFDATPKTDKDGRKALQGQMDQVKSLKDQLSLQSDQLGFSQKYGDQTSKNTDLLGQAGKKMLDIGSGFANANVKQFESDIGISGNGAVPQLASQGLSWLGSFLGNLGSGGFGTTNIHVNSVDEAMAAKQNQQNKQALQWNGR